MQGTADIKRQILSIQNTAKVTKAMQLISAAKMKKFQTNYQDSGRYITALKRILSNAANSIGMNQSLFLMPEESQNKSLIVVIGNSRGFVGALASKLSMEVYDLAQKLESKGMEYDIISIKKRTMKAIARYGIKSDYHFDENFEGFNLTELQPVRQIIMDGYYTGKYKEVYIVYTKFISALRYDPTVEKLLPMQIEKTEKLQPYLFEDGALEMLKRMLGDYIEITFYNSMLSATVSEYAARMAAMQKASDNANKMAKEVEIQYFKTRQGEITQQIQENVNASLAAETII